MALTVTDILKFRESENDPWQRLLLQANINFNLIYPVGSIYMSTVNVNPATLFGGTWEQLEDRFLLGAGTTYTAGDTGGEAEHTLTENEMPSHRHNLHDVGSTGTGTSTYGGVRLNQVFANNYTNYVGGGQAHNNMPPYIVVYMWKRLTLSPSLTPLPMNVLGDVASQDIVPVSMGGTGADNAADAIANLGFESDTNYCKMPDGTLICWGSATFPDASVGVQNVTVQYPVSFESAPFVTVCWNDNPTSTKNYMGMLVVNKNSSTKSQLVIGTDRLRTGYVWYVSYIAIGRWK